MKDKQACLVGLITIALAGCPQDEHRIAAMENRVKQLEEQLQKIDTRLDTVEKTAQAASTVASEAKFATIMSHCANTAVPSLQAVGEGFLVARLEVEKHALGTRVSGLLVNSSSLGHSDSIFDVKVLGGTGSLSMNVLPLIGAGRSATFSAILQGIDPSNASYVCFEYQSSTIHYGLPGRK